jgi:hypothetical protein
VVAVGVGRIARIDERGDLVAQVVLVAAEGERVQELRAAVAGPAVDEHDDRVGTLACREHRVEPLEHRRLEPGPVEPHVELARVALDDVDARQRARVVEVHAGWAIHVQRPPRRVPERVVRQQLRFHHQPVERAVDRALPGRARGPFNLVQCHARTLVLDRASSRPRGGKIGAALLRA